MSIKNLWQDFVDYFREGFIGINNELFQRDIDLDRDSNHKLPGIATDNIKEAVNVPMEEPKNDILLEESEMNEEAKIDIIEKEPETEAAETQCETKTNTEM